MKGDFHLTCLVHVSDNLSCKIDPILHCRSTHCTAYSRPTTSLLRLLLPRMQKVNNSDKRTASEKKHFCLISFYNPSLKATYKYIKHVLNKYLLTYSRTGSGRDLGQVSLVSYKP